MTAFCVDCGKPLIKRSATRCKRCSKLHHWSDPAYRNKSVDGMKRAGANNLYLRQGRSERVIKQWADGDESKLRQAVKQGWQNGSYVNLVKAGQSPDDVAKRADSMKERWQDPEYIELFRVSQAEGLATPEAKVNKSVATKRRWDDPESRRKLLDGIFGVAPKPSKLELSVLAHFDLLNLHYIPQFRPRDLYRFYDALIPDLQTLVEVDGDFWHHSDWAAVNGIVEVDTAKNKWALANGYNLVRLRESYLHQFGIDVHTEDALGMLLDLNECPVVLTHNGVDWIVQVAV